MMCSKYLLHKHCANCIAGRTANCSQFNQVKCGLRKTATKKEDGSATDKLKWLTYIAPGLALLAPGLYIVGFLYHEKFLEQFGLNAADFPKTTQEYFIFSYYCFLIQSFNIFKWIGIFIVLLLTGFIPYVVLYCWWNKLEDRFAGQYVARFRGKIDKNLVSVAMSQWEKLFNFCMALFVFMLVTIFAAFFAVKAGKDNAKQQQEIFQGCDQSTNKTSGCTFLLDNNKVIASGLVVARNSTHLALYANGKAVTYPVKDFVIESYPKKQ